VTRLDYLELRELYARSRFVVVPLYPVLNQAGITTMLEAMAMGKAVVVTATPGQQDVIRGRKFTAAGPRGELMGGPAAFGVTGPLAEAETGLYVPPRDPAALRSAIQFLLNNPTAAARMGTAGRQLVEEQMSLDLFVGRLAGLIRGARSTDVSDRCSDRHLATPKLPAGASGDRS
jgi:glycosyltransferase involved in cell wall biosynthesis